MENANEDQPKDEHLDEHKFTEPVADSTCKVFINRIPEAFSVDSLIRLVESATGEQDLIEDVGLVYEETDSDTLPSKHKGFAFMTMKTAEQARHLISLQTLKGGAKPNSKKKHTLYLSAVSDDRDEANFVCFLWKQKRCPYGEDCKFKHTGEGACLEAKATTKARKTKCWEFMKKGSCKQGESCPFLHVERKNEIPENRPSSEKDCLSWKTKGKCSKRDACPFRHDEGIRERVLAKKKKRQLADSSTPQSTKKVKQPLSVRVFGLNYETTISDVKEFFGECGTIKEIKFPTFEDSGRSKGYCELLFTSPKAVQKAVLMHETELHGRWLSIQAGKMLEQQWQNRSETASEYR